MLHGSINHVSITVSDLPAAMRFFGPLLEVVHMPLAESRARARGLLVPGR